MRLPSPNTWARIHAVLTISWAILIVPSVLLWRESIWWVVLMSCYANVAGSAASWQAAKADCNSPTVEQLDRLERKVDSLRRQLAAKR